MSSILTRASTIILLKTSSGSRNMRPKPLRCLFLQTTRSGHEYVASSGYGARPLYARS